MSESLEILSYYNEVMNKKTRKTSLKIIDEALKKYTSEELKSAIDGCYKSDYHMNRNGNGKEYNSLSLIFRINSKTDKVAFFMNKNNSVEYNFLKNKGFNDYEATEIYNVFGYKSLEVVNINPYDLIFKTTIEYNRIYEIFGDKYNNYSHKIYNTINKFEERKGSSPNLLSFIDFKIYQAGDFCKIVKDTIYTNKRYNQKKWINYYITNCFNNTNVSDINYTISSFLNKEQKQAVLNSKLKLSLINGSAGTGKTTVIKEIIKNNKNKKIAVTAFTGKACDVINTKLEDTFIRAKTIHKLLDYNCLTNRFNVDESNKLDADIIIVDESSMINSDILYSLLISINEDCRIVLVGDTQQLKPIGYGEPFRYILSKNINTTTLLKIERQSLNSDIIKYSNQIASNTFKGFSKFTNDFYFIDSDSDEKSLIIYEYLIQEKIKKSFNYDIDDIQTLSAKYEGLVGINNLNKVCKGIVNKGENDFNVSDRVIQLKNDYKKNAFNGNIGKIVDINTKNIHIDYNNESDLVKYNHISSDKMFKLAYTISIHKSQGSEFPVVLIVLDQKMSMLEQKTLYTAITRAQKKCIIIGNLDKFERRFLQ